MSRVLAVVAVFVLLVVGLAVWRHQAPAGGAPVVIGAKKFPESKLLADMLLLILQERGIPAKIREGLAGNVAFTALQSGAVDAYVEYTGTGLLDILHEKGGGSPQQVYDRVKEQFAGKWQLEWLQPIGFEDKYALAMRADYASANGIKSISQLVPFAPRLTFGPTHEFYEREDCYPNLKKVYGLAFGRADPLEHGLAYKALLNGKVDVVDAYTTDGNLDASTIVVLDDDRHAFPPYYAAPVARQDTLRRVAGLRDALNTLAGRIDDRTMQALNHKVETEKFASIDVAREFLAQQGLVAPPSEAATANDRGLLAYMWHDRKHLMTLTGQDLYLTGVSMALAVLVGMPLGILITRFTRAAGPVLGAAGIMQTVPSLALLAFMIPYLGLGEKPAIAALFLYGLLPIVRNTYAGIRGVDPALLEVAEGMGLTRGQRLFLVEMPLASAIIMAGVRTAVVIAIGTATLAAFIGAGGLGDPIVSGLSLNDDVKILSGAVPAALLAIVVDLLLGLLERLIVPRALLR